MNIIQIQDLIKFVSKSGVSAVEIEQKDFKIIIRTHEPERKNKQEIIQIAAAPLTQPSSPAEVPVSIAPPAAVAPSSTKAADDNSKYLTVKSPMIGTFYRSAGPDKPAFAEVGSPIKAGSTVCIIEAMKLFNEIESEVSGTVVKVLVNDNTPVEYDQPLFLIDPN